MEKEKKSALLEVEGLHVHYRTRGGEVYALNGLDLAVERGERLGLVGETGAGKTTLALSILRLLPEDAGIDSFHVYEVVWEPGGISWLVDGKVYAATSSWSSGMAGMEHPAPFDKPFYLLINLAVGGSFDEQAMGCVTANLPAEFRLDYIRIFQ